MTYTFRTSKNTVAEMVVQYNDAAHALFAYRKQEQESLSGFAGWMQSLKGKMRSILQYTTSITSITRVWAEVKRGVQYVREIDSALTELKKVTEETEDTYNRFLKTAAKTADKVGSTIKEVVSSTADWARLGYSLKDATTLAETTSVLLNVSEFQSIDDATKALTSTMQAFGYVAKDSMHVVDVMNEIGNNYAISSDGIATALQDSASSLMAANNSYQESVALIAAANRVVQDPNSVGAALRTISLRLRGTSTKELEEAGEDTTGVVESKSKLRTKIQGYT
jgi:TP901 family phage tail tape measure protein